MIKLVITSDSKPPMTRCFEYSPIIIGGPGSKSADLQLDDPSVEERHLQITSHKSDGKTVFYAHNIVNDPFSTLNGLPFGKQPIGNNDLIQINDIAIRFEIDNPSDIRDITLDTSSRPQQEKLERMPEAKHHAAPLENSRTLDDPETIPVKPSFAPVHPKAEPTEPLRPFAQLKLSESTFKTSFPYTQPKTSFEDISKAGSFLSHQTPQANGSSQPPKLSLKDYYLSEYDDENDNVDAPRENNTKNFLSAQLSKQWRFILILTSLLFVILATTAGLTFLWVSGQSTEEEIEAAKGVADVAMALTYAQLKHIQPQNQNWSHHEFLKNNLYAIMAPGYLPLADFDSHGQFANCPYMLRIHTNSDSTEFLVIAQPAPSLLHWLIPKASIILDSNTMQLRKIKDIKALNRLIVNANLDGASATEISNLVSQGTLIPLSALVGKSVNQAFATPKNLESIRPGAENLVYNAPRYYLLGETVLETSLGILEKYATAGEVQMLQQEINSLTKYPNLVLYSSDGYQNALEAQKALAEIAPRDKFLVAYLKLTPDGKIASSQLLDENAPSDLAVAEEPKPTHKDKEPVASAHEEHKEHKDHDAIDSHLAERHHDDAAPKEEERTSNVDANDPLFLHLMSISAARQQVLKPIGEEIATLLKKETHAAQPDFASRFSKLQQKYLNADRDQQAKMEKKFEAISHEYAHLPASSLMDFVKAADLEIAFKDYLKMLNKQSSTNVISDEMVAEQIKRIETSANWPELESAVVNTNKLLRFENIPGEQRLIAFQNTARLVVTQKLNQFILTSDGANDFAPDHLQALSNILKHAWIVDPETYDFYIDEFELREPQS